MRDDDPALSASLPASMAILVDGYDWSRDLIGESGASVYRLHRDGQPDLYLKHGTGAVAAEIGDEMLRLRWLKHHLSVPQVRYFECSADDAWLLMTSIPGCTASQWLEENPRGRREVVGEIARFLRRFHDDLPVDLCPFNSRYPLRMAAARGRLEAGLVDASNFDADRDGWTPEEVWSELTALPAFEPDEVVTHGDFSLENILVEDGRVTGCIDFGRLGSADRYQDLAILSSSLGAFGGTLQKDFFDSYGIAYPDERKIYFHLCLSELL